MAAQTDSIIAWTDGGCRGNPGVGAWAFLLADPQSGQALERAAAVAETTNNRMEMTAAIMALRALRKPGSLVIRSDSRYLIDCCCKWLPGWKARGWRRKEGALKNVDLLQELDGLLGERTVTWEWVAGHSGEAGNERVDALANRCMDALQGGTPVTVDHRRTWP